MNPEILVNQREIAIYEGNKLRQRIISDAQARGYKVSECQDEIIIEISAEEVVNCDCRIH